MTGGLDELLPLFLSEAFERLDKIETAVEEAVEAADLQPARRELHTLKGAGRMMGFDDIAELCHTAETLIEGGGADASKLSAVLESLRTRIEALTPETAPMQEPTPAPDVNESSGKTEPRPSAGRPGGDFRMPVATLDTLSHEGARMRVLSSGAAALVDRLHLLSRSAETGVDSSQPRQVLAGLSVRLRQLALETERAQRRFDRLVEGHLLQLLSLQVQPVRPFLLGLARHARTLAESLGKTAAVEVRSVRSRLDRRTMEALKEVLLHLVRNAVDHGLESDEERRRLDKPLPGSIVLGTETVLDRCRIFVVDDGMGIDSETVLETAVEGGFVTREAGEVLGRDALLQLLFQPGFTTRTDVTNLSGRGVGLDAVAEAVRAVGGDVWISSTKGKGCRVTLELPVAQRGEKVLVVETAGLWLAFPSAVVRRIEHRAAETEGEAETDAIDLAAVLGLEGGRPTLTLHLSAAGQEKAVMTDAVVDEEEVFIRPLPTVLNGTPIVEGMAMLNRGRPVPVIDVQQLAVGAVVDAPCIDARGYTAKALRVLLVDDSRVTREMLRRVLSDAGFSVSAAEEGEAALRRLEHDRAYDCLVTDIEMPGMDGLELCRQVRRNPATAHLPIVVISTLGGSEDRMAGLDAGADAYLTKQSMVLSELVDLVGRLGGEP